VGKGCRVHRFENFEEIRLKLLKETLNWEKEGDMAESFKGNFFKLLELCIFSLMNGEDNFFCSVYNSDEEKD
jgi:hypothetical protein